MARRTVTDVLHQRLVEAVHPPIEPARLERLAVAFVGLVDLFLRLPPVPTADDGALAELFFFIRARGAVDRLNACERHQSRQMGKQRLLSGELPIRQINLLTGTESGAVGAIIERELGELSRREGPTGAFVVDLLLVECRLQGREFVAAAKALDEIEQGLVRTKPRSVAGDCRRLAIMLARSNLLMRRRTLGSLERLADEAADLACGLTGTAFDARHFSVLAIYHHTLYGHFRSVTEFGSSAVEPARRYVEAFIRRYDAVPRADDVFGYVRAVLVNLERAGVADDIVRRIDDAIERAGTRGGRARGAETVMTADDPTDLE